MATWSQADSAVFEQVIAELGPPPPGQGTTGSAYWHMISQELNKRGCNRSDSAAFNRYHKVLRKRQAEAPSQAHAQTHAHAQSQAQAQVRAQSERQQHGAEYTDNALGEGAYAEGCRIERDSSNNYWGRLPGDPDFVRCSKKFLCERRAASVTEAGHKRTRDQPRKQMTEVDTDDDETASDDRASGAAATKTAAPAAKKGRGMTANGDQNERSEIDKLRPRPDTNRGKACFVIGAGTQPKENLLNALKERGIDDGPARDMLRLEKHREEPLFELCGDDQFALTERGLSWRTMASCKTDAQLAEVKKLELAKQKRSEAARNRATARSEAQPIRDMDVEHAAPRVGDGDGEAVSGVARHPTAVRSVDGARQQPAATSRPPLVPSSRQNVPVNRGAASSEQLQKEIEQLRAQLQAANKQRVTAEATAEAEKSEVQQQLRDAEQRTQAAEQRTQAAEQRMQAEESARDAEATQRHDAEQLMKRFCLTQGPLAQYFEAKYEKVPGYDFERLLIWDVDRPEATPPIYRARAEELKKAWEDGGRGGIPELSEDGKTVINIPRAKNVHAKSLTKIYLVREKHLQTRFEAQIRINERSYNLGNQPAVVDAPEEAALLAEFKRHQIFKDYVPQIKACQPQRVFHGTSWASADEICQTGPMERDSRPAAPQDTDEDSPHATDYFGQHALCTTHQAEYAVRYAGDAENEDGEKVVLSLLAAPRTTYFVTRGRDYPCNGKYASGDNNVSYLHGTLGHTLKGRPDEYIGSKGRDSVFVMVNENIDWQAVNLTRPTGGTSRFGSARMEAHYSELNLNKELLCVEALFCFK